MTNLILSTEEKTALSYHENVIEKGLKTFIEVGQSLQYIRDNRLYRADFNTFDEYMSERWGKTRAWASNMIKAVDTMETLTKMSTRVDSLPESEKVIRPLAKLKDNPELMAQAWIELTGKTKEEYEEGLRKSPQPTHKEVEEKVKEYEAQIKQLENENKQLKDREKHKDRVIQERNKTFSEVIAKEKELKEKYDLIEQKEGELKIKENKLMEVIEEESNRKLQAIKNAELKVIKEQQEDLNNEKKLIKKEINKQKELTKALENQKKYFHLSRDWLTKIQSFNDTLDNKKLYIISTIRDIENSPDLDRLSPEQIEILFPYFSSVMEKFESNVKALNEGIERVYSTLGITKAKWENLLNKPIDIISEES